MQSAPPKASDGIQASAGKDTLATSQVKSIRPQVQGSVGALRHTLAARDAELAVVKAKLVMDVQSAIGRAWQGSEKRINEWKSKFTVTRLELDDTNESLKNAEVDRANIKWAMDKLQVKYDKVLISDENKAVYIKHLENRMLSLNEQVDELKYKAAAVADAASVQLLFDKDDEICKLEQERDGLAQRLSEAAIPSQSEQEWQAQVRELMEDLKLARSVVKAMAGTRSADEMEIIQLQEQIHVLQNEIRQKDEEILRLEAGSGSGPEGSWPGSKSRSRSWARSSRGF